MRPFVPRTLLKAGAHRLASERSLDVRKGAPDCVHAGVGSKQGTGSVNRIIVRQRNASMDLRSALSRTPRRRSEGRDAPMDAVGRSFVMGKTRRRNRDDVSFKAPCRDVYESRDESSGAKKVQTMG